MLSFILFFITRFYVAPFLGGDRKRALLARYKPPGTPGLHGGMHHAVYSSAKRKNPVVGTELGIILPHVSSTARVLEWEKMWVTRA
jgi:hypothetical protein